MIIGRDTRISGEWIERTLRAQLSQQGIEVDSVRVLSTPGVAYLARREITGSPAW